MSHQPIVESLRGELRGAPLVDGVHLGSIAAVAPDGAPVAAWGDPGTLVHLRSTAKPFQLMPLVMDGIHRAPLARKAGPGRAAKAGYTIEAADLAVMMASHSGEPAHTGRVARLLEYGGLEIDQLQCGAHPPVHVPTSHTLIAANREPTALHCNCSGKHTGMLLVCTHKGWPLEDYLSVEHPLQRRILALVAGLSGVPIEDIGLAVDGCSAPTFALPLSGLALLFARLAAPEQAPEVEPGARAALREIFAAGVAHPELVGGTGRLDTALMRALGGVVFAKVGAMGAYGLGVGACERYPKGLGVAVKIADGDGADRVRRVVVPELLIQLGLLDRGFEDGPLRRAAAPETLNNRGMVVGKLRPCFEIFR